MKPLARKLVATVAAAALVSASVPLSALAAGTHSDERSRENAEIKAALRRDFNKNLPQMAADAEHRVINYGLPLGVSPAQAMQKLREWGVYGGNADVLGTYIGFSGDVITPLGAALYLTLEKRYAAKGDMEGLADEVRALKPTFDQLRQLGPMDDYRDQSMMRALKRYQSDFGKISGAPSGSVGDDYREGVRLQALLTGAAVADPPRKDAMTQVQTPDGYDYWDDKGVAFRINKQNATVYNRQLQQNQHKMNMDRPPQVPFIPETGRYNPETFEYSYWRLKNQYDALSDGLHRDRMLALAELLGIANQFRSDTWLSDKRLEADIEAQAKAKFYRHHGKDYSVWDIVEPKFRQREAYLQGAATRVARFKSDMDEVEAGLKKNPIANDGQVQTLALDEQSALRWLSLGVLETQSYYVKTQQEHLDPSSPDSQQLMDALDKSKLSGSEKDAYKVQCGQRMVSRLKSLDAVLEQTRRSLSKADYAVSMDLASAALASSQKELTRLGSQYSLCAEMPTSAFLAGQQTDASWLNFGGKFMVWAYRKAAPGTQYAAAMRRIEGHGPQYDRIMRLIAAGRIQQAETAAIAMNPDAARTSFSAVLGRASGPLTEDQRLTLSLQANRDLIGTVFNTNKWLNGAGSILTVAVGAAVLGPALRGISRGTADGLDALAARIPTGETMVGRIGYGVVRFPVTALSESLKHAAARLQLLDPNQARVEAMVENRAGRLLLSSTLRGVNAAARQMSFTALSGGISGGFTALQHVYDNATEKVWAPGKGRDVPMLGWFGAKPSMFAGNVFDGDFRGLGDAFWTGAENGVWWANDSWHPALGYVGLPSSALRGTPFLGVSDVVGARGVVGSAWTAGSSLFRRIGWAAEPLEGESLSGGALDTLSKTGLPGKILAFNLGMADNVAKYALFSEGAGWVGRTWGYNWSHWSREADLTRRIKGANSEGDWMLQAPLWMLIPTFSAHQALEAQTSQLAMEGMRQYDAAGRWKEYATAEDGATLPFVTRWKAPLAQRFFDFNLMPEETGERWTVTEHIRRLGIRKTMLHSLAPGVEDPKPSDVNPMRFYEITTMPDGAEIADLRVNDEVRYVGHQNFVEALVDNPKLASDILAVGAKGGPAFGARVSGFGRVTPEVQKDVAVALYSSKLQIGRPMPAEVAARVNAILEPYLKANEDVKPFAKAYVQALDKLPKDSEKFDAVLDGVLRQVSEWRGSGSRGGGYLELVSRLRTEADAMKAAGKISGPERDTLVKLYDYIDAVDARFNSFNNVGRVRALNSDTLAALRTEYPQARERAGRPVERGAAARLVGEFSQALDRWAAEHPDASARVDGQGADGSYQKLIGTLRARLEKEAPGLSEAERKDLGDALDEMAAAPWIVHDSHGSALHEWRPEQFESLMGALTGFAHEGRDGASVRLFQMLKTGGGKTMLAYEGLLPVIEADAKAHGGLKPVFLTVQSNLEAQARMEFIAYKKIGSTLDFDTYEGFKTKVAEGKIKGKDVLEKHWIMGDEFDGAALQPPLTIGAITGRILRLLPVYRRIADLDAGVADRLDAARNAHGGRLLSEANRIVEAAGRLRWSGAGDVRAEADALKEAVSDANAARGADARAQAEARLRASAGRLDRLLKDVPSGEGEEVAAARESLRRLETQLSSPPDEARLRRAAVKDMTAIFRREKGLIGLTGSEAGLRRLALAADVRAAELEARVERLTDEAAAAETSKAPGASERAAILNEQLAEARDQLSLVESFQAVDSGSRLATLQDKLAAARLGGTSVPAGRLAEWRREAERIERSLPPDAQAAARERAGALARLDSLGRELGSVDAKLAESERSGRADEALRVRRAALESDYTTTRAEIGRWRAAMSADPAPGDLGAMMSRLDALDAQTALLQGQVDAAKMRGERAGPGAA
ncbi:MAG: hypothetical protein KGM24_14805, partial [Elusimicrobia bacterium]|nr:hypothetical protein [Elusimicrobiota bacterium]